MFKRGAAPPCLLCVAILAGCTGKDPGVIVTKEGTVEGARVLSKAPAEARAAILESVRGWLFRPSTFNERAVPVYFTVTLRGCP